MKSYYSSDPAVWFLLRGCFSLPTLRKYMDTFAGMLAFGWEFDYALRSRFFIVLKSSEGFWVVFVFGASRLSFVREGRFVFRNEEEFITWRKREFCHLVKGDDPVSFLFWQLIGCERLAATSRSLRRWRSATFWSLKKPQLTRFPESGFLFSRRDAKGRLVHLSYVFIRLGRLLFVPVCYRFFSESSEGRFFIGSGAFSGLRNLSRLFKLMRSVVPPI